MKFNVIHSVMKFTGLPSSECSRKQGICRSSQAFSTEHLIAAIDVETAENGQMKSSGAKTDVHVTNEVQQVMNEIRGNIGSRDPGTLVRTLFRHSGEGAVGEN